MAVGQAQLIPWDRHSSSCETGTAHPARQADAPMCGCCAPASAAVLGVWLGAYHVSNMPEAFTWGGVQDKLVGVLGV